jgi:hypothetical protein
MDYSIYSIWIYVDKPERKEDAKLYVLMIGLI